MPEANPTVSALILARDEAHNLPGCIDSLDWVDEIVVVVDPAGQDETESVARRKADAVLVREFDDFASQRNAALNLARGDWIFSIDADERAGPELGDEIRSKIRAAQPPLNGFKVPIRSVILGRSFSYSGTQNDNPLRLFRRTRGRWIRPVHEIVRLEGTVGQIERPLRHRTIADMREFLKKIDRYASLEAVRFRDEGRPVRTADLTAEPLLTFLKLYIYKQGFRDGLEGFVFCAFSAMSVLVRNWKRRELARLDGRAS